MDRREFLKSATGAGALAATAGLAAPAISQRLAARTLRFVPQADLANFDPIWGTQYVVRNAAVLVWDTLYGFDETLTPQRQMVEAEENSADGLTWTFKLRSGLKFHDGSPFTAADVVIGSGLRWGMLFKLLPERPEFLAYVGRLASRPALQRAEAQDKELAAA